MLDALRKRSTGPTARVLIAALVVAFALWGVQGAFNGGSGSVITVVGGREITATEFSRRYQAILNELSQFSGALTPAQAEQLGVSNFVLYQLVQEQTLNDQAAKLRLGVSDTAIAAAIRADPTFWDGTGRFNSLRYDQLVRQIWGTERAYLAERRPQELRAQIANAVAPADLPLAQTWLQAVHEYEAEERTILYAVLTEATLGELPAPTEEEILAQYRDDATQWNAPEARTVLVLEITPTALAIPAAVTEEELRAAYLVRQNEFGTIETRRIWQQLVTADQRTAVETLLAAGLAYDDLITLGEIAPADVGIVGRGFFVDAAVGDMAFALPAEGTAVVQGRFGLTLVHVGEVHPGVMPPFEEVQDVLRQDIAEDRATAGIPELRDRIEDARAAGATLAEVAARFELTTRTIVLDAAGNDPAGGAIPDLPGGALFITAVFDSDVGLAEEPLDLAGADAYLWFEVLTIRDAYQRPIEEVRDRVIASWHEELVDERLAVLAETVLARLRNNELFYAVAAELTLTLDAESGVKRTAGSAGQMSGAAIDAAFAGPRGQVGSAATADGEGLVVFQVVDVTVPPLVPELITAEATNDLRETLGNAVVAAYTLAVQQGLPAIRLNSTLVQRLVGVAP